MIRLLLVDDHALFREGLATLLASQADFEVVAKADSVEAGLRALEATAPDLILLDVDLGGERAIDFLRQYRETGRTARVLVVTAGTTDPEVVQLLHAGCAGVFHKHHEPQQLCEAIRKVASGEAILEPQYLKSVFRAIDPGAADSRARLSDRELHVMAFLLRGHANKEIGAQMDLSESSVKAILRGLFDKLGVRTRSQLVKIALEEYRDQLSAVPSR